MRGRGSRLESKVVSTIGGARGMRVYTCYKRVVVQEQRGARPGVAERVDSVGCLMTLCERRTRKEGGVNMGKGGTCMQIDAGRPRESTGITNITDYLLKSAAIKAAHTKQADVDPNVMLLHLRGVPAQP